VLSARVTDAGLQQDVGIFAESRPDQIVRHIQKRLDVAFKCVDVGAEVLLGAAQQEALGHHAKIEPVEQQSLIDHGVRIVYPIHVPQDCSLQGTCFQVGCVGEKA